MAKVLNESMQSSGGGLGSAKGRLWIWVFLPAQLGIIFWRMHDWTLAAEMVVLICAVGLAAALVMRVADAIARVGQGREGRALDSMAGVGVLVVGMVAIAIAAAAGLLAYMRWHGER